MTKALRALILPALVLFSSACNSQDTRAAAIAPPADFDEIRSRIAGMVDEGQIPSLAVAVARDGQVVWMEGFGWSDRDARVRATPDTIYAIGSTSKSLTATLAMALAEKGLLDIDRTIDVYVDGRSFGFLAIDGEYPTVRELLAMIGGVPHGGGVIGQPEYELPRDEMMRRVAVTAYPPGTVYEYSNYSIGLAMAVMEQATGRSYAELMRQHVFAPLGMHRSFVSYRPSSPDQAALYDSEGLEIDYYRFFPEAAGGFYSSVSDLMRFALFHAGQWGPGATLVSAQRLEDMHAARPGDVPGANAALGFGHIDVAAAGGSWLISNGNVRGGNCHVSIFEADGGVVVTAVNMTSRESLADAIALDIAEVLKPGIRSEFKARVAAYRAASRGPFESGPEWAGRWQGVLEAAGYSQPVDIRITQAGEISMAVADFPPVDVAEPRGTFGSVTGTLPGLAIGDTGRGASSGSPPLRLSLQDGVLYGHVVLRISDGNMRGNYPYRMRLTRP